MFYLENIRWRYGLRLSNAWSWEPRFGEIFLSSNPAWSFWPGPVKKFDRKTLAYHPILIAQAEFNGTIQTFQMKTGKINDGINIQIKENPSSSETYHWFVRSAIGILPPGRYTFKIMLNCDAGQRILYDGLRLFFIELAWNCFHCGETAIFSTIL